LERQHEAVAEGVDAIARPKVDFDVRLDLWWHRFKAHDVPVGRYHNTVAPAFLADPGLKDQGQLRSWSEPVHKLLKADLARIDVHVLRHRILPDVP
jgi:hypothetical protein